MKIAALYTRVSSVRQRRQETITSQVAALLDYAQAHDSQVSPHHIYQDEGHSGASLFDELPNDVAELVRIIQGLGIYDLVAVDFYGCTIPDQRTSEIHLRSMEQMLGRLLALDDQPLCVTRSIDKRLVSRCHHFTRFLVAMLRAKGVPARARCGFGAYFNPGYFEDHWICEYWNAAEARWVLVDPQFDDVWRTKLKIDHNILDVLRDRFLVAGDAWARCRTGEVDPAKFGIVFANLRGLWYHRRKRDP